MSSLSKPDPRILALAEKIDPGCGKEFNLSLCRIRHLAAKKRESMGKRTEYEPCCYCPHFVTEPKSVISPEVKAKEERAMCPMCGKRPPRAGFDFCACCLSRKESPGLKRPEYKRAPEGLEQKKETESMFIKPVKPDEKKTCKHCKSPVIKHHGRGLCHKCYFKPEVKELYPANSKNRRTERQIVKKIKPVKKCVTPGCENLAGKYSKLGYCKPCACKLNSAKARRKASKPAETTLIDIPGVGVCPEPAANTIHARSALGPGHCLKSRQTSCVAKEYATRIDPTVIIPASKVTAGVFSFIKEKQDELLLLNRQAKEQEKLIKLKLFEINTLERFLQDLEEAIK